MVINKKIQAFKSPLIPLSKGGKLALPFEKRGRGDFKTTSILRHSRFYGDPFPSYAHFLDSSLRWNDISYLARKLFIVLFIICSVLVSICFLGCGSEEPFDKQDNTPVEIPNSITAIDLPSAEGDSWEYATPDSISTYTAKIAGTKNIGGYTVRILQTDSQAPVDFTGAGYGFPVRNYFFTKDSDTYTEYAFELWVDFLNDTYFQRYIPKRIEWSFPLYEGKEWIVSKLYTEPAFTYTRKVVSASESITVPAGTYTGVFRVEESVSSDTQPGVAVIFAYWLVRGVGVIKYQYPDPISTSDIIYELRKFTKG